MDFLTVIGVLRNIPARDGAFALKFVDAILDAALKSRVSDIHFQPVIAGLEVRWRIDGVLHPLGTFARGETSDVVSRLKVLANLLTYQSDMPQEGRLRDAPPGVEMRISTFPTLHGERAVVRIFAGQAQQRIADLGLAPQVAHSLSRQLGASGGALIITGPAGSGKTTTACACLREIVAAWQGQRCLVSLEDPIETILEGVSQTQVNLQAGLTLETGLKSLLRQDPEVIFVGEIRDQSTARLIIQAALTGHLVITTFHAGSAAGALSRLLDWQIEPYQLRSGLLSVLSQRLVRRLCECGQPASEPIELAGVQVNRARAPRGCEACLGTGYHGRMLLHEWLDFTQEGAEKLFQSRDRASIEAAAIQMGMQPLRENGIAAVTQGKTSPAEFIRALGLSTGAS